MLRKLALFAVVPVLIAGGPALAITAKQKKETCEIGAKEQGLTGKAAADFVRKCMAKGNYEPQARKDAMKKKKPAPKKPPAKKPAPKKMDEKKQDQPKQ